MLVNTLYRSMVGYVVEERLDADGDPFREPVGTLFFVSILGAPFRFEYAVTCAHVVGPCRDGSSPELFLRINRANGEYEDIPTANNKWIVSEGSDIAVLPIAFSADAYRRWSYPIDEQMRAAVITPLPGDQVFMVGLFTSCPGELSVQALIRSGTIASERSSVEVQSDLSSERRHRIDAYLIESHSWGGESGSPVFAYRETLRLQTTTYEQDAIVQPHYRPELIGMLHGHYIVEAGDVLANSGIAIVITAEQILEFLTTNDVLVERRKNKIAAKRAQSSFPRPL